MYGAPLMAPHIDDPILHAKYLCAKSCQDSTFKQVRSQIKNTGMSLNVNLGQC